MATGTPVITNVHGELQTILEPLGAAEVIAPDSLTALVDAIDNLVSNPARRQALSAAAIETAKRYDRIELAEVFLAFGEELPRFLVALEPGERSDAR